MSATSITAQLQRSGVVVALLVLVGLLAFAETGHAAPPQPAASTSTQPLPANWPAPPRMASYPQQVAPQRTLVVPRPGGEQIVPIMGPTPASPGVLEASSPRQTWAGSVESRCGVHCDGGCQYGMATCPTCQKGWESARMIPWQIFAQGEYIGPARLEHVPEYRLRVDDLLDIVYRLTAEKSAQPYRLNVGDLIRVQSLVDKDVIDEVWIQPDGTVTLPYLGQVPAADRTVDELRKDLNVRYKTLIQDPNILVTPIEFNTRLQELRATVDNRAGRGGQFREVRVTPEGTIQLPGIGSVFVQGLTLDEAHREIEERYRQLVPGMGITPILVERAPRYVYVLGEVRAPGRYTLEAPTTAMQAIALAGSWNVGAHLRHIVVFRRDHNWRLMATKLDLRDALFGTCPCPVDEIWLRDSDIVLVPKSPILASDDFINLLFTRGVYSVIPFSVGFSMVSTL